MDKVKIGIFTDLRFTSLATPTGVTKHIVEMINGLNQYENIDMVVLATKDQLTKQGKIPSNNALADFKARPLPYSWHQAYLLWLAIGLPSMDKYAMDLDWVYCPKNDFIPFKMVKTAITIHGAHEIDHNYPRDNSLKGRLIQLRSRITYKRICKNATVLLTVSEFLKTQMINWFNATTDDIHVVGNGVEDLFYKAKVNSELRNKKQLLSIGGLNRLDGGDRIIHLAEFLKKQKSHYHIVVAGNQHEPSLLEKAKNLDNLKLKGYVKATDLSVLMQQSQALLFLTRYETFGIAAIEAMASGLPVITCQTTAVPEIVGEDALYVNPENSENIYHQIKKTEDDYLRKKQVKQGVEKAQKYKWQNCVKHLYSILTNG